MGFWNNIIGIEDDEDEDEELEELEEEKAPKKSLFGRRSEKVEEEEVKEEAKAPAGYERKSMIPQTPAPSAHKSSSAAPSASAPVPSANRGTLNGGKKYTEQVKLVVIEPRSFDESPKLVDSLKAKKPVIINLENLDTDVARKVFDFLSGATYALNGNVQKVANNIFLFAPENVDVMYSNGSKPSENASNTNRNLWK